MLRRPPTLITLTSDDIAAYDQSRAQRLSDAAARKAARLQQLQLQTRQQQQKQQQQQAANPPQPRLRAAGATHPFASRQVFRTMDGSHDASELPPHPRSRAAAQEEVEGEEEHEEQESSIVMPSPSHRLAESFRRGGVNPSLPQESTTAVSTAAVATSQRREPSQSVIAVATPQQQQSTEHLQVQQDQQAQAHARAQAEQERRRRRQERIMGYASRGTRGAENPSS